MADLDAREQLFLELINRARMDPLGEAARYGIDLNAGLSAGTISSAAKQVLAPNAVLEVSAQTHSEDMLARDYFAHNTQGSGDTPGERMADAGYGAVGSFGWGENLAWTGSTGTYNADAEVYTQHKNLFLSSGHRVNTMNGNYEEIGIGAAIGQYNSYNAMMTSQNFAYDVAADVFVTGVHYNDTDNNDFYSIGEGQGGRTVEIYNGATLLGSGSTTAAGGYGVELTTSGQVEVAFSGGNLAQTYSVFITLAGSNAKVDLVDGSTIETNFSATLGQHATGLRLLGVENVSGTGNALNNTITGNSGNNTLDGAAGADTLAGGNGDDRLIGGLGSDTLIGGNGNDTAVFSGEFADYQISYAPGSGTFTLQGLDGSIDTVSGVEFFEFATDTFPAQTLQLSAAILQTVSVSTATASVAEGNLGNKTVTFTVTVSGAMLTTQTVGYSIAGTGASAADGSDIQGTLSGTITFLAGETVKTITVDIVGDKVVEANETFALTLSSPSSQMVVGTASATVTISNDDVAPVMFTGDASDNSITGSRGYDIIDGLAGHDTIKAGSGDDEVAGGLGNDYLDGGTGADLMTGGAGDDRYVVDNMFDVVDEATGSGTDTILSTINFSLLSGQVLGDVENLTLTGTKAVTGEGNDLANIITGNGAKNTLTGHDGNDRLDGGRGADILIGGNGNDTYVLDSKGETVDEQGSSGVDLIESKVTVDLSDAIHFIGDIENVTLLGSARANVTGNGLANTIFGSTGNNVLSGLGGNDSIDGGLGADVIIGGMGDDTLTGGVGKDRFHFDAPASGSDIITDFEDGIDKLSFSLAVADNISDFTITGNGTNAVVLTFGGESITLNGVAPITIDSADLLFV